MILETAKQRGAEIPVPLVHGVLIIDLSDHVDDHGWLDGAGLSIPFVPAGVAVEIRIGHARSIAPFIATRLADSHLRLARSIDVKGNNASAIADLVAGLRRALPSADDQSWLDGPAHGDPWAAA